MKNKNLEKKNNGECPICLEEKALFSVYCNHSFCAVCIRKSLKNVLFDQQPDAVLLKKGGRLIRNSHRQILADHRQRAFLESETESEVYDMEDEIFQEENFLIEGVSFKCPVCRFFLENHGFLVYK